MKILFLILITHCLINGQFVKSNLQQFNICEGFEYLRPEVYFSEGKASITVDPTQAIVNLVIESKQDTASQALDQVSTIQDNAIKAIKANISGELKIQTVSFYVNPYEEFDYTQSPPLLKSKGFDVRNTLSIETHNVDEVGKIIDLAVKNGVNQINNVLFTISQEEKTRLKNTMIDQAILNAKHQAEVVLKELGMEIESIKQIHSVYSNEDSGVTFSASIQVGFIITPLTIDK